MGKKNEDESALKMYCFRLEFYKKLFTPKFIFCHHPLTHMLFKTHVQYHLPIYYYSSHFNYSSLVLRLSFILVLFFKYLNLDFFFFFSTPTSCEGNI